MAFACVLGKAGGGVGSGGVMGKESRTVGGVEFAQIHHFTGYLPFVPPYSTTALRSTLNYAVYLWFHTAIYTHIAETIVIILVIIYDFVIL